MRHKIVQYGVLFLLFTCSTVMISPSFGQGFGQGGFGQGGFGQSASGNGFGNGFNNNGFINSGFSNNNASNNGFGGFGNASSWINGFSQALVQVPQFTQSVNSAPQLAPFRRGIQLGANIQNTETGVQILNVVGNGLAQASGLQPGDIIVAVGGYQVGFVNNRTYDVVEEIQKRMNPQTGEVSVLVLRGARLGNLLLSANPTSGSMIAGRVALSDGTPIAPGSILKVELQNLTRRYQQIAGGSYLGSINSNSPFPYEIHFDPQYIDAGDQYQLFATISTYQGQLLAQGALPIPSPALGQSVSYDISLQGAQLQSNSVGYLPGQDAIVRAFQTYLNRNPDVNEQNAWLSALSRGSTVDNMKAELLASRQFYDLSGNNDELFLTRLVQVVQNRQPTNVELNALRQRLASYRNSRLRLVQDYLATGR